MNFEITPIFNYEVGDEYTNKYVVSGQFIIQEQSTLYFVNEIGDKSDLDVFNIPLNSLKTIGDSVDYSGYICKGLFLLKNSLGEYIDGNLQLSSEKYYIGYYDESIYYLPEVNPYLGFNMAGYFKIPDYQNLLSAKPILCDINGVEVTDPDRIVLKESFESFTPIFYDLSEANFTLDYKNYMYVTPTLETFQNYDNNNVNDPITIPVDATNELSEIVEVGLTPTILKYGKYTDISSIDYNDTYGVLPSGTDSLFLTGNTSRKMFSPAKFSVFYGQHYQTDYA